MPSDDRFPVIIPVLVFSMAPLGSDGEMDQFRDRVPWLTKLSVNAWFCVTLTVFTLPSNDGGSVLADRLNR